MYTPFSSRHFTIHIDPVSHVRSAILTSRVAPVQQSLYFVFSGYSDDARYLWFMGAYPPAAGHMLCVVDFLTDELHAFPEARGSGFMVDPATGNALWTTPQGIFTRTPHPGDAARLLIPMPDELRRMGPGNCGADLTLTPDRRELVTDVQTREGSVICSFEIATGAFHKWYQTEPNVCYNHAAVCPTDGDLCLCAHEGTTDCKTQSWVRPPLTPEGVYPRLQLIRRDGSRRMLLPQGNYATHEWWLPDGRAVYYCNNGTGSAGVVAKNAVDGGEAEVLCDLPLPPAGAQGAWHAHCTKDERYVALDSSFPSMGCDFWRGCESMLRFHDRRTGKTIPVISRNPVVKTWNWNPANQCAYHIDPHPRFVLNDALLTFTTTVRGHVDLAVAQTEALCAACERG